MWGAARRGSILSGTGVPWVLAMDTLLGVKRDFLRQSRIYVAPMQEKFPLLENFVHADNALAIRWLRWCGFTVAGEPEVINGERFFRFWREI